MSEKQEPKSNYRAGVLDEVFERHTTVNSLSAPALPRRKATFVVSKDICLPDAFEDDFELTLHSLTAAEEMRAAKGVTDPLAAGYAMGKMSMCALNGDLLKNDLQREMVWELIGSTGRQLVLSMYNRYVSGSEGEDAEGKAHATVRVS
jgi:hypothetical protein